MAFRSLIGTLQTLTNTIRSALVECISIPHRYPTNGVAPGRFSFFYRISIPHRYPTNSWRGRNHRAQSYTFRSLIGTLQTDSAGRKSSGLLGFRSLIGTLQTREDNKMPVTFSTFRSLIGTLQTLPHDPEGEDSEGFRSLIGTLQTLASALLLLLVIINFDPS